MRACFFSTLMLLVSLSQICAQETPAAPLDRIVGSVHGKAIRAADIGLTKPIDPAIQFDARDEVRWALMRRIMNAFGKPVADRFVKQRKIEATADELETFKRNMRNESERRLRATEHRLAEVNRELAAPNLRHAKRVELQEEQVRLEIQLPARQDAAKSEIPTTMARMFIIAWKTERELHRTYGGRVIFQQGGPEALDARRLLYEGAEKSGALKFDDAGVRHMFYYYYANMRHTVIDETSLEQPWFLGEGR